MYKITATIHKEGGSLVRWEYYSEHRLGKKMCRQALKVSVAGSTCGYHVVLENYRSREVRQKLR